MCTDCPVSETVEFDCLLIWTTHFVSRMSTTDIQFSVNSYCHKKKLLSHTIIRMQCKATYETGVVVEYGK